VKGSDDMSQESKSFRIEATLFDEANVVLKGLGTSMPEAITEYLEHIIMQDGSKEQRRSREKTYLDEAEAAYSKWF